MRKKTYRYYVNHSDSSSAVYHGSLRCWIFYHHRKDGKVGARSRPVHGFDTSFKGAVTQARKEDYNWVPKASGWIGGNHTVSRQLMSTLKLWKELHEHVWAAAKQSKS